MHAISFIHPVLLTLLAGLGMAALLWLASLW